MYVYEHRGVLAPSIANGLLKIPKILCKLGTNKLSRLGRSIV
jgi:hypothetical protein